MMMKTEPAMPRGLRGAGRLAALRLHRLVEFERVFDLYLKGKVPASLVTIRAKKMLAVGLPRLR
jgi:hypothetical protein